jgi:hypothetical protein
MKCEKIQMDARLRNLAIQLAAQLHPDTYSREEAQEVLHLLHELVEWQYGKGQPARDLRVVALEPRC